MFQWKMVWLRNHWHILHAAIKHAVTNKIELMEERCSLYEQMGEMSKALTGYTQILNHLEPTPENDDKYLKLARRVCEVTWVCLSSVVDESVCRMEREKEGKQYFV